MEKTIKALDRKLLVKATITLLYFIPIIGITNRIYVEIYDEYILDFSQFVTFAEGHLANLVVAFLFFALIFLGSYFVERHLIPYILILSNKTTLQLDDEEKRKLEGGAKKVYGINILKVGKEPVFKFDVIADICFFFIVIILWLIYWHTCIGYVLIAPLILIFLLFVKSTVVLLESDKSPEESENVNAEIQDNDEPRID